MAVLATDDFNRPDNADLGANWLPVFSSMKIVSQLVEPTDRGTDALEIYDTVTWPNDQYAQIVVGGLAVHASDIGFGVALRVVDANNYYRATCNGASSNNVEVRQVVGGSPSVLATLTEAFVNGDTLYAEIQGTTIKVKRNGVQFGGDITGSGPSAGDAGIMYSSTATTMTADDFVGGDFSSPAGDTTTRRFRIRRSRMTSW